MIDMNRTLNDKKGFTLIELLIVISIIGVLAIFAVPEYGIYIAKSKTKKATSDLLQNMRTARTMAIKENRAYLMTFNEGGSNGYRVGSDEDDNGSLMDDVDEFYNTDVRVVNMLDEYGVNLVLGSDNFTTDPPNGPNAIDIVDSDSFQFNPDGTVRPGDVSGAVYLQHNGEERGYTYCVFIADLTGLVDLFMWNGYAENDNEVNWTELR